MKKITLLTAILCSFIGYSQANRQMIQTYLDNNKAKLGLTSQDVSDWAIQSEVPGSGTKITSTYCIQQYHGTEIFNSIFNIAVKDGKIFTTTGGFQKNVAQRVNATAPVLSVLQGVGKAYTKLGVTKPVSFSVAETINDKSFKLSDGVQENQITAKLVYFTMPDNNLILAWHYEFYSLQDKHLYNVKIDALTGDLLSKVDLTINCSFEPKANVRSHKPEFNFNDLLFNSGNASTMVVTPGSYKVIPYNYENLNTHPFELITTAGDPTASPNGWHDINSTIGGTTATLKFTYTRGNNVLAQEDADGNNGSGLRADGGAALNFDFNEFVNGVGQTLQPTAYTNSALTNLFYMNNSLHDMWYQYGFNEASGNFQKVNYGRGGAVTATGDPVQADGQDGWSQTTPTLNNANFAAPADGALPRMQMYMWTLGAPPTNFITINSPASIAGPRAATTNVFEGTDRIPVPIAPNGITSDLVLYTNTPVNVGQNPNSACAAATNPFDISGKIVLIKRGGCFFSNKVKNAQDAGALAAIVMDTVPNNPVRLSMSSTGLLGITIPAVFISKESGDEILTAMATSTVNLKLEVPADLYLFGDGDFDNGIMAHEFEHGISGRFTGGPANSTCLTSPEQQGEGWSDWATLMLQVKPGDVGTTPKTIGTFAVNEPITGGGLRNFPYTTDMTVNPLTFGATNGTLFDVTTLAADGTTTIVEPHQTGEIWCAMLWDLSWAYMNKYGIDADLYFGTGGNNKVMRLVLDAMKLQPCNPSYVQARDAIIAADQATTGGQDYCMIWQVFAKRGLGVNASSGDNSGTNTNIAAIHDQVEDFTEPAPGPNCTLAVNYFDKNDNFRVYPNPSNGLYNIHINQFSGKVNFQVTDINGRTVYNQTDEHFNVERTLNLSSFQSGVYILKISGDDVNYTQKLIKN